MADNSEAVDRDPRTLAIVPWREPIRADMDDGSAATIATRARRTNALAFGFAAAGFVVTMVIVGLVVEHLLVGQACPGLDRMAVTRQPSPAAGEAATYCLPGALEAQRQHPELPMNACITFHGTGVRPSVVLPTDDRWAAPLGVLISPDDHTLTLIWRGARDDLPIIVEGKGVVRVGVEPSGPLPATEPYHSASAPLAAPLGRRSVRLIRPRPGSCD